MRQAHSPPCSPVRRCQVRAGHAYSILRRRLKPLGKWCSFQVENQLPRTSVWEVVEVYEAAVRDGLDTKDLADRYSRWTEVLLAYGLAKPRKNKVGGCLVEPLKPPTEEDDDAQDEDDGQDFDEDDLHDKPDPDEDESDDDAPDADPPETTEVEPPPVTDDQVAAADAFISTVGGLVHAVRVLITKGANSGDGQAVKDTVAEAVRTACAILTPSEIREIVIVGNSTVKWVSV